MRRCSVISTRWSLGIGSPPHSCSPTSPKWMTASSMHRPAIRPCMPSALASFTSPRRRPTSASHAARAARCFPEIFTAVADGRLHLSAVVLLAPHLTEKTASDLIAAAAHRSKSEIKELLVARTPQPEVSLGLEAIDSLTPQALSTDQHAPGRVGRAGPTTSGDTAWVATIQYQVHDRREHEEEAALRGGVVQSPDWSG